MESVLFASPRHERPAANFAVENRYSSESHKLAFVGSTPIPASNHAMTLYEYLKKAADVQVVDHSLRTTVHEDGSISFYIHPARVSGDTIDFVVSDDGSLTPGPYQQDVKIPANLDEAVAYFISLLSGGDKKYLTEHGFPNRWHHHGGMSMRNDWGLWSGSRLAKWFQSKGITHADDMSDIIAKAVTAKLRGEPFDLKASIKKTQAFWAKKENGGYPKGIPPAPWEERRVREYW